jgi:hypothetical protein
VNLNSTKSRSKELLFNAVCASGSEKPLSTISAMTGLMHCNKHAAMLIPDLYDSLPEKLEIRSGQATKAFGAIHRRLKRELINAVRLRARRPSRPSKKFMLLSLSEPAVPEDGG